MRYAVLLIVLCILLGATCTEAAPLSGVAEWRYGQYQAEEEGEEVFEGSFFTQQYSLLYQKSGRLANGRAGAYDFALGAEWTSIDSEINSEKIDVDTFKPFYRGDILIAPGGLPFRLHLYSNDMHRTTLTTGSVGGGGFGSLSGGPILTHSLISDLSNGQHIVTGATLLVGIRNGSYMGAYRDVLSQLPRLLVDYQESYVRDLKSRVPQHYRDRNLAFVSLNKKDNWFHYRLRDYQDFENPAQNFTEKTYMLGTVDHILMRQWINLTNWIRISADGSYTITDRIGQSTTAIADPLLTGVPPNKEVQAFDVNMFATARRSNWDAASFTNFHRTRDLGTLTRRFEVPFYVNGEFDRNTSWRFSFLGTREGKDFQLVDQSEDRSLLYLNSRIETFRRARFILAPHLAAEVKGGDLGEGVNIRAGAEFFSNRAFNPRYDIFAAYSLARFSGTARTTGESVDYWEQEFKGRIETRVNARLRTGAEQNLLLGSGDLNHTVAEQVVPRGSQGLIASTSGSQDRSGDLLRSTTTWFGEYIAASRLSNRLELTYDYLTQGGVAQDQLILRHSLRYDRRNVQINVRNEAILGDAQASANLVSPNLGGVGITTTPDISFTHASSLNYSGGRAWEATGKFDYDWTGGNGEYAGRMRLAQSFQYNFFTINGIIRKLADLREDLEFERHDSSDGGSRNSTYLTLQSTYYPTKRILLGAVVGYRLFWAENIGELTTTLTTGLNFEKLIVSLDYSYGSRTEGELIPDRQEHRWEMKVKKVF